MPSLATILRSILPPLLLRAARSQRPSIIAAQKFEPVGVQDFIALQIPPREMLLDPILPERSLAMLYAPRGIGKSWLGLSIGLAVASGGSLLRWHAPSPRRVLLCDGEMPLPDLQARLSSIMAGFGARSRMTASGYSPPTRPKAGSILETLKGNWLWSGTSKVWTC